MPKINYQYPLFNVEKFRKEFPVLRHFIDRKKIIYFDNACTVLKPQEMIDAVARYYGELGGCAGNRSAHALSWLVQEQAEAVRFKVKNFLGASSEKEIIWTKNATEGINIVASSLATSKRRNEILLSCAEHHSAILPFLEGVKRNRMRINTIPLAPDGSPDVNRFKKILSSKTALVVLTHLSNVSGHIFPVRSMAKLAHKAGARVLIDDAQYLSLHRERLSDGLFDFVVFSGHKLGGPTGIGVLYAKKSAIKSLKPFIVGGGTVKDVSLRNNKFKAAYLEAPLKFEAGVQNYAGIYGLGAAIDFLTKWNVDNMKEYVRDLTIYALARLSDFDNLRFLSDYSHHKPHNLFSFFFNEKGFSLRDFNIYLNEQIKSYSIAVRCGHHCASPLHQFFKSPVSIRLSFFAYNTKSEVDVFIDALGNFLYDAKKNTNTHTGRV